MIYSYYLFAILDQAFAIFGSSSGIELTLAISYTSTKNGISCLEVISPIPEIRKPKTPERKK